MDLFPGVETQIFLDSLRFTKVFFGYRRKYNAIFGHDSAWLSPNIRWHAFRTFWAANSYIAELVLGKHGCTITITKKDCSRVAASLVYNSEGHEDEQ